jgi:hypothetical protein
VSARSFVVRAAIGSRPRIGFAPEARWGISIEMDDHHPPLNPAQEWVLATAALLNQRDGKRLDLMGGALRPSGTWQAFFNLMQGWGVQSGRDALERCEWLIEKGYRGAYEAEGKGPAQAFVGWDACRAANVAGWAYAAYLIDRPTAWQWQLKAAAMLQRAYSSWAEVGQSYVRALHHWSDGDEEVVGPTAHAAARLSSDPSSPWVRLPFAMDLSQASVPPEPFVREVHVGPAGHARTIGDGVRMAGPDGRVIVAPGHYRENVEPEHPVEIVAAGQVVLESAGEPCVRVVEERTVVLRGLTLRAALTPKGDTLNAVHVVRAFARLEGCDVAASNDGVQQREWSACHVFDSRVQGCGSIGLNSLGGFLVVLRSEIAQSAKEGIKLAAKGPSTVEDSRIHANGGAAVLVEENVELTARAIELLGNGAPAQLVASGNAHVTVEGAKIVEGRGGGVMFQDTAHGSLEDVAVSGTALAAVDLATAAFVSIEELTLDANHSSGVIVRPNGRLLLVGSKLDRSKEGHVWIMSGAQAAIANCHIGGGKLGVWVQGGATAYVYRTVVEQQEAAAIDAQQGARVVVSKCRIAGAGGDGVIAAPGSSVDIAFAEIGGAGGAGVRAVDGASVRLADSVVEGCRSGDVVGRVDVAGSKISGQLAGATPPGAPEARRAAADEAFDRAVSSIAEG